MSATEVVGMEPVNSVDPSQIRSPTNHVVIPAMMMTHGRRRERGCIATPRPARARAARLRRSVTTSAASPPTTLAAT